MFHDPATRGGGGGGGRLGRGGLGMVGWRIRREGAGWKRDVYLKLIVDLSFS